MKRLSALAFIGALALASLTACSSDGGDIDDFCSAGSSFGADSDFEFADLSDADVDAAVAGDMSGVNEWGESSVTTIDAVVAEVERAKGGAPTDEVAQALDDVAEVLQLMRSFAVSASEATDFAEFTEDALALTSEMQDVDAKMTAAGDILDDAEVEYCS
jgi:hypothetical protein